MPSTQVHSAWIRLTPPPWIVTPFQPAPDLIWRSNQARKAERLSGLAFFEARRHLRRDAHDDVNGALAGLPALPRLI